MNKDDLKNGLTAILWALMFLATIWCLAGMAAIISM